VICIFSPDYSTIFYPELLWHSIRLLFIALERSFAGFIFLKGFLITNGAFFALKQWELYSFFRAHLLLKGTQVNMKFNINAGDNFIEVLQNSAVWSREDTFFQNESKIELWFR